MGRGREEGDEEREWEGRSRIEGVRDRFRGWNSGDKRQGSREGSGQRGRQHSMPRGSEEEGGANEDGSDSRGGKKTRTGEVESDGEDADTGSLVSEDHTVEDDGGKKKNLLRRL